MSHTSGGQRGTGLPQSEDLYRTLPQSVLIVGLQGSSKFSRYGNQVERVAGGCVSAMLFGNCANGKPGDPKCL
jgi:hypothetical protein